MRKLLANRVHSLSARFIGLEVDAKSSSGYARELNEEERRLEQTVLASHVAQAECGNHRTAIPGRDAPKLIFPEAVERMTGAMMWTWRHPLGATAS